jgi:flagellar biosynthesis/type III secretory pathway M-ring protein FliF/YscJ
MVPLLNQSFSANDLGQIQNHLGEKGVAFTVSGDKLLVPADRRMEILSDLTYLRLMPHNTQKGFEEIAKDMSPFDSENKQQKIWNHGKELALSQIIGNFPGVASADVIIDPTNKYSLDGNIEPTATVNITLQETVKPSQKQVDAAADAVSGAVAGLKPGGIKIVINGAPQRVHDAQDAIASGSDQLELLQQNEVSAEQKVREVYHDCPTLLVQVKMKLNTTSIQTEKHDFDAKGAVQKATKSTTETETTSSPNAAPAGDPGVSSNTAMVVSGGSGSSASSGQSREKTDETYTVGIPETRTTSRTPAGDATAVSAALRVPLSYIARTYQLRNGSTQAPTYAQLKPLIDEESQTMRQNVANCVGLASPDKVAFETYADEIPSLTTPPVASASGPGLSKLVGGHAREIALGTLAMMSLFMASMMVRKAAPAPISAAAPARSEAEKKKLPFTFAGEDLAGEATATDGLLDGMELNEETVKAGRMVEQVSSMVRENPDAAAALVKRWLSRP